MGRTSNRRLSDPSDFFIADRNQSGIVLLGASELSDILSPKLCLAALEEAYADLHRSPDDRGQSVEFRTDKGKFHVKAGLSPRTHRYFAAKVNANFPENPELFGLPTIQGLIVLFTCEHGKPVAVLHSGALTGRRTAAATALAAKHCAREESGKLAIIGCGAQASYQVESILDVLPIRTVIAYDSNHENARKLAGWAEQKFALEVRTPGSLEDAVGASDVCVTTTTSTEPLIDAGMVPLGCFIAAVGADNPDKQEIDPRIFATARIVVDDLKQTAIAGDLAHAVKAGIVGTTDVHATLADLAAGAKPGRTRDDEIVIFDSTGTGIQDVAAAAAAYEAAPTGPEASRPPIHRQLVHRMMAIFTR